MQICTGESPGTSKPVKVLQAACEAVDKGEPAALVTVVGIAGSTPRHSGSRMLVYSDGSIVGTIGGGAFEFKVIEAAIKAIQTRRPVRYSVHLTRDLGMCCGGAMEAYIEPLEKSVDLIIYGAGHVGAAVASMAEAAGFRITVVDERDEFADPDKFSNNTNIICDSPLRALDLLPWGEQTYHLIVTHSHQTDQDLVERILPRQVDWVGMIGSRTKVAKFFIRLRAAGMDEALFQNLSAPVGLDIGAETPEEIAVSIVAELIRVRRRSTQPPVPLSSLPIEARGGTGRAIPPGLADTITD